jgi:hypothetical protein
MTSLRLPSSAFSAEQMPAARMTLGLEDRAVDHIALSAGLRATGVAGRDCLDNVIGDRGPRRLSDHHPVSCLVQLKVTS